MLIQDIGCHNEASRLSAAGLHHLWIELELGTQVKPIAAGLFVFAGTSGLVVMRFGFNPEVFELMPIERILKRLGRIVGIGFTGKLLRT